MKYENLTDAPRDHPSSDVPHSPSSPTHGNTTKTYIQVSRMVPVVSDDGMTLPAP